jgi:hypothetical protein
MARKSGKDPKTGADKIPAGDAALIKEARDRFKVAADAESKLRKAQQDDKRFAAGDQWPDEIKRQREAEQRPCLTIDRLKPQIKQVTNQQRSMRPAIKVAPATGGDKDTAEVYRDLCRTIEYRSNADDAYDQAGRDQVIMGRGYIRIETDYLDDQSFNQEIKIKRVRKPESIYFDPAAEELDYADAMYAIEAFDLPLESYKARFPKSKVAGASLEELREMGDEAPGWISDERIRVIKYWHVETVRETLDPPAGSSQKPRTVEKRKVRCELLNALEVLEPYEWPGKYIPIVPVIGEEIVIEGEVDYRGMVRGAKDPQRMTNYWKSAATEMVALAKSPPWIIAEGQIEGYQKRWEDANRKNYPFLVYKETTAAGRLVPPPQRNVTEPPIQAVAMMIQASENDTRAATGFYDVGERESREQSGRAILARQKQGELGNSDFLDGLARGIRHVGRILIDLIPHIYDVPRVMELRGIDDKSTREVLLHAGNEQAAQAELQRLQGEGRKIERAFDLGAGGYDVTVSAGPSYQTARQEFAEGFGDMVSRRPELMQIAGDLYFDSLDIPHATEIAERMRKMLPPQLQEQPGQEDIPPAVQAQMQQAQQQIELMGQALQEAQQKLESKQLEIESKERIAQAELELKARQAELEAEIARFKAQQDAAIAEMKLRADLFKAARAAEHDEQRQALELGRDRERQQSEIEARAVERASQPSQNGG